MSLNEDWEPGFGTIFIWFAMDKFGRIAVMVNNCWGDIPKVLLSTPDIKYWLDNMSEYLWEESKIYVNYPKDKNGDFFVDLYSAWMIGNKMTRDEFVQSCRDSLENMGHYSDTNIAVNKGIFMYFGVEGCREGEDYPVGYIGETKMGDYYRQLVPTLYGSIDDFPEELSAIVAVSDSVDFTKDRVLDNNKINDYFPAKYDRNIHAEMVTNNSDKKRKLKCLNKIKKKCISAFWSVCKSRMPK
ncbi:MULTISPECIES: hypothetical protein [unclassified Zymobacter]|uniref:hypothetical protein n=1 Tax=unclassified Zymobacter TaxID=3048685 RepID=UPI0039C44153